MNLYYIINNVSWSIKGFVPWGASEREWEDGGSQTWVIPAAAISGILSFRELYHPPLSLEPQLKPWTFFQALQKLTTVHEK